MTKKASFHFMHLLRIIKFFCICIVILCLCSGWFAACFKLCIFSFECLCVQVPVCVCVLRIVSRDILRIKNTFIIIISFPSLAPVTFVSLLLIFSLILLKGEPKQNKNIMSPINSNEVIK